MIETSKDTELVAQLRKAMIENGGYCPCVVNPTEDDKCMCKDFRDKLSDPAYDGWCHCRLFHKVKENI